jgi:gliding motility associated protien GldN
MKKVTPATGVGRLFTTALACCMFTALLAQSPVEDTLESPASLDDFTTGRNIVAERKVLKHAPVREADVFWEKRVWRVIDTREKMNLAFTNPEAPLFNCLSKAALNGEITVYSSEDDKFTIPMSQEEVQRTLQQEDTVSVVDVNTMEETIQVVQSELNWEDVKRFRIKEVWWFDKNRGELRQRILGIAPLIEVKNDNGDFLFERPLFWVHYPSVRPLLARQKAYTTENLSAAITWEDLFEMRHFSSYITKESNVYDRRLQDYLVGTDLLMEGNRIKDEIFNLEHDLWSW